MENETAGYTAPPLPPPPWAASPPDQTTSPPARRDFDTYDTNNDGKQQRLQLLAFVAQLGVCGSSLWVCVVGVIDREEFARGERAFARATSRPSSPIALSPLPRLATSLIRRSVSPHGGSLTARSYGGGSTAGSYGPASARLGTQSRGLSALCGIDMEGDSSTISMKSVIERESELLAQHQQHLFERLGISKERDREVHQLAHSAGGTPRLPSPRLSPSPARQRSHSPSEATRYPSNHAPGNHNPSNYTPSNYAPSNYAGRSWNAASLPSPRTAVAMLAPPNAVSALAALSKGDEWPKGDECKGDEWPLDVLASKLKMDKIADRSISPRQFVNPLAHAAVAHAAAVQPPVTGPDWVLRYLEHQLH